eukprot:1011510-Prymnesium_polylepis.2
MKRARHLTIVLQYGSPHSDPRKKRAVTRKPLECDAPWNLARGVCMYVSARAVSSSDKIRQRHLVPTRRRRGWDGM